jgi:hypothetical protein
MSQHSATVTHIGRRGDDWPTGRQPVRADSNECHSLVTSLVCGLKFEVEYAYIEN